jgi:hypothetical protein
MSAIKMIISQSEFKRRFTTSGTYAVESDDARIWKIINIDAYNKQVLLEPMDESEYRKAD